MVELLKQTALYELYELYEGVELMTISAPLIGI